LLFEVLQKMECSDEIVFADEMGSWMIPIDHKEWIAAYLTSLARTEGPEAFAAQALPLLRRNSGQSFRAEAYKSALKVASEEQTASLELQIQQHNVRVGSDWRQ